MCIFTNRVGTVEGTRIFARYVGGEQILIYEMSLSTDRDTAMVLPLPALNDEDDPITFIDLQKYPKFFNVIEESFQVRGRGDGPHAMRMSASWEAKPLPVEHVGAFEASFVPTLSDFRRLDRRFRLPGRVWRALPQYEDFRFAVFKLAAGAKQKIHPFGLRFRAAYSNCLFFPTIHLHDGQVRARADYDHYLYCQIPSGWSCPVDWDEGFGTLRLGKLPKGVMGQGNCFEHRLLGTLGNEDHYLLSDGADSAGSAEAPSA